MRRLRTKKFRFQTNQKLLVAGFALLFAVAGTVALRASLGAPSSDEAATERLVVIYKPGAEAESLESELAEHKAVEVDEIKALRAEVIKVPPSRVEAAIEELSRDPRVETVEPDYIGYADVTTPNDSDYSKQQGWSVTKTNELWDVTKGTDMVVAVADSGIAFSHSEFAGKTVPGYDFVNEDDDPADDNGHGTNVSGLIAALSNNSSGVTGGCWNCRIMPLKVLGSDGQGYYSDWSDAIRYAADHGVKVLNMSASGSTQSTLLQSAVEYAEDKGMLIVTSAGNEGDAAPRYPASYPSILSVSNTKMDDSMATGSSYGPTADVAAPGTGIYTTSLDGKYASVNGTSFSAPITTAIASLLLSTRPSSTPEELRTAIVSTADECCENRPEFPGGRVNAMKAYEYLDSLPPPDTTKPTVTVSAPAANATVSGTVNVTATASDNVGVTKVEVQIGTAAATADETAPYSVAWDTTTVADGAHTIKVTAYDAAGNTATANVPVTVKNTVTQQGDLNNDSKVNITDLSILLTNWNTTNATADINQSGKVDLTDLSILLSKWTG
jgi:subtilisin family serine protease